MRKKKIRNEKEREGGRERDKLKRIINESFSQIDRAI